MLSVKFNIQQKQQQTVSDHRCFGMDSDPAQHPGETPEQHPEHNPSQYPDRHSQEVPNDDPNEIPDQKNL